MKIWVLLWPFLSLYMLDLLILNLAMVFIQSRFWFFQNWYCRERCFFQIALCCIHSSGRSISRLHFEIGWDESPWDSFVVGVCEVRLPRFQLFDIVVLCYSVSWTFLIAFLGNRLFCGGCHLYLILVFVVLFLDFIFLAHFSFHSSDGCQFMWTHPWRNLRPCAIFPFMLILRTWKTLELLLR